MPNELTYMEFVEWLKIEPDPSLIVDSVLESIKANTISADEIDALRSRVLVIKNLGHEEYLKNNPETVIDQVFPDRKPGGCQSRSK